MSGHPRDAVVVGGGPNGLAAAIHLASHDLDVLLVEAADRVGGAVRSDEGTLPGFVHDVGSAIHPLALASPFLSSLPLEDHGLRWIHPDAPLAHALGEGEAIVQDRSVDGTARRLGRDAEAYRELVTPLVDRWGDLVEEILAPAHLPRHPLLLARFGLAGLRSAHRLATSRFEGEAARALFAGCAAHSFLPLERRGSAAVGLVLLAAGHAVGWPFPAGGAARLAEALEGHARDVGVEIRTGWRVRSVDELPPSRALLLDVTPRQLLEIAGDRLPTRYARRLRRYRYGPAAFKIDWALDGPIPWRDPAAGRAATVHVGGPLAEVADSERAPAEGRLSATPFVLLAQHTLFDPTRAPEDRHTAWAYCHVPNGWPGDATEAIEAAVERFAPGFRSRILARRSLPPDRLESWNPNLVGGDINGGVQDLGQLFARPVASLDPYSTPVEGLYLCSSSTPPGGGVHGMCGYHAARSALRRSFGLPPARSGTPGSA